MRFRAALVFALALATVTACGRGEKAQPPAQQQRPATPVPMPPKPDTTRTAVQKPQPAPDTAKKPAPARPAGKLYTVQVAAFLDGDSARKWTGRLSSQGLPVWSTSYQVNGKTFHRVRVGAVPTIAEARQLADMLKKRYSWPVWIAPVSQSDAVPDGAVQATQRILEG
ncbi:MAG TPA: SPOR domain-containing protein [Longimicrobiales bacterium]|nr:SPOR domain-containing protein [Longimicrobiales bacterium]